MSTNPYDSPYESAVLPPEVTPRGERPKRPIGVTLLAILLFLAGLGSLAVVVMMLVVGDQMMAAMADAKASFGFLIGLMGVLAGYLLATSVGMWIGQKWGWWLAAFNYIYGIVSKGASLALVFGMPESISFDNRTLGPMLLGSVIHISISSLITLYFFKNNVLEYFGLPALQKSKAFFLLVAISIILAAASTASGLQGVL